MEGARFKQRMSDVKKGGRGRTSWVGTYAGWRGK